MLWLSATHQVGGYQILTDGNRRNYKTIIQSCVLKQISAMSILELTGITSITAVFRTDRLNLIQLRFEHFQPSNTIIYIRKQKTLSLVIVLEYRAINNQIVDILFWWLLNLSASIILISHDKLISTVLKLNKEVILFVGSLNCDCHCLGDVEGFQHGTMTNFQFWGKFGCENSLQDNYQWLHYLYNQKKKQQQKTLIKTKKAKCNCTHNFSISNSPG